MNQYLSFNGVFRNEAVRVRGILDQIKYICAKSKIFIVVQESQDHTLKICKEYTDNVFEMPAQSPEECRDFLADKVKTPWFCWFDGDETLSFILALFLQEFRPKDYESYDAIKIPRVNYVDGVICDGGQGKDYQYKILRRDVRWGVDLQRRIHIYPMVKNPFVLELPVYHTRSLDKIRQQTQRWNELQPELSEVCNQYVNNVEREVENYVRQK